MSAATRRGAMVPPEGGDAIAGVRRFNRFYTPLIGLLREGYLDGSFSLTQVRVLFELANRERPTAAEIARDLALDPAYLSRILAGFAAAGLTERRRSESDGRERVISLTARGREVFGQLDLRSEEGILALLAPLPREDRERLVASMETIQRLLGEARDPVPRPGIEADLISEPAGVRLRRLEPGELGWVVERHGVLYAEEFRWDQAFEALVARIVADYGEHHDPRRENA